MDAKVWDSVLLSIAVVFPLHWGQYLTYSVNKTDNIVQLKLHKKRGKREPFEDWEKKKVETIHKAMLEADEEIPEDYIIHRRWLVEYHTLTIQFIYSQTKKILLQP
ncbi:hypothetical protein GGI42DRAFT_337510 [Trichoderma sp. SZMC 28013]